MSFKQEFEKTAYMGALIRGGMALARGLGGKALRGAAKMGKGIKNVSPKAGPKLRTSGKAFKQELTPLNMAMTGSMVNSGNKGAMKIAPRRSIGAVPKVNMGARNVRI